MLKRRALVLSFLCFAAPAQAGLFSDDEAREQIKQLEAQVGTQLDGIKQQAETNQDRQTRTMLDMQGQIESLRNEIRMLRGQNEELAHGLQAAEKREKDFYTDLDTRLRHFESSEKTAQAAAAAQPAVPAASDPFDPVPENRSFENAYGMYKKANYEGAVKAFQDFIRKYPDSALAPNANYWLGDALFALQDYQGAIEVYQGLLRVVPDYPRAADVLYTIAGCQQELKDTAGMKKTLKRLIAKYPDTQAAAKARKLLAQ